MLHEAGIAMKTTARTVPGFSVATLGFAMALFVYESSRLTSLHTATESAATYAPSLGGLACIAVLMLAYRAHPLFRLHRSPAAGFCLAALFTASMFVSQAGATPLDDPRIVLAASILSRLCECLLFACWAEVLTSLKARDFALLFSVALAEVAALNALTVLIKIEAIVVMLSLLPLLSMGCLYWYKDRQRSIDVYDGQRHGGGSGAIDSYLTIERSPRLQGAMVLLMLFCFSFEFGNVHFSWVPLQDGAYVSLSIQLGAALGTLLAGVTLMILATSFWGRNRIGFYPFVALAFLTIALYLTMLVGASMAFLYVIMLNIAQKVVFFLVWLTAYRIPVSSSPLVPWLGALGMYQAGKFASSLTAGFLSPDLYAAWAAIVAVALTSLCILSLLSGRETAPYSPAPTDRDDAPSAPGHPAVESATECRSKGKMPTANEETAAPNAPAPETAQPGHAPAAPLSQEEALTQACATVAATWALTRRESEVLELLAQGMTARAIAETLVVSTPTAKSHIRNIYQKTEVHTQNELMILVMQELPRTGSIEHSS